MTDKQQNAIDRCLHVVFGNLNDGSDSVLKTLLEGVANGEPFTPLEDYISVLEDVGLGAKAYAIERFINEVTDDSIQITMDNGKIIDLKEYILAVVRGEK